MHISAPYWQKMPINEGQKLSPSPVPSQLESPISSPVSYTHDHRSHQNPRPAPCQSIPSLDDRGVRPLNTASQVERKTHPLPEQYTKHRVICTEKRVSKRVQTLRAQPKEPRIFFPSNITDFRLWLSGSESSALCDRPFELSCVKCRLSELCSRPP